MGAMPGATGATGAMPGAGGAGPAGQPPMGGTSRPNPPAGGVPAPSNTPMNDPVGGAGQAIQPGLNQTR
jgi:hypothetical protein